MRNNPALPCIVIHAAVTATWTAVCAKGDFECVAHCKHVIHSIAPSINRQQVHSSALARPVALFSRPGSSPPNLLECSRVISHSIVIIKLLLNPPAHVCTHTQANRSIIGRFAIYRQIGCFRTVARGSGNVSRKGVPCVVAARNVRHALYTSECQQVVCCTQRGCCHL